MASASDKNKKTKSGVKKAAKETSAAAKTAAPKKTAAKKTAVKKPAGKKAAPKKSVAKKPSAKKPAAKKAAAKKTVEKKAAVKKKNISKKTATPKKSAPKKAAVKKAAPKKAAPKKAVAKKAVAKKVAPKKTTAAAPQQEELSNHNMAILFLVGLTIFAALSFGVFKSGRDGGSKENERNLMIASQVIQFGIEAGKRVEKLQADGVALSRINFDPAAAEDDETALFSPAGGGMIYEEPMGTGKYMAAWKVLDVSDARDGFLVSGLGSDAAVRGREVVMYFEGLEPEVCSQMRKGWGLDPEIPVQEVKLDFDHRAAIRAGANATTFYATPGRAFSCFRNGRKGPYIYYQALSIQ
jgi:hypothetical protein